MMAEHQRYLDYVHRTELRFLRERLPKVPPRVLDLGCGAGRLACALAPFASEVVGIESAGSLVERARTMVEAQGLNNVRIEQGSIGNSLPPASAEVVLLSGVLNYVDEPTVERALREVSRALASNGLLFIRNNCATRRSFYVPAGINQPPTLHRTADEYLAHVRSTAGLEVVEDRYLFPPLCLPNLVYYHVLPKRLRQTRFVGRLLDAWFDFEGKTAETRLKYAGRLYPPLLSLIRKPTAFRMIVAERRV